MPKKKPPVARLTARYIAAVYPFIAKNDIRYYLNGIYIEPLKKGGTNMIGTDGHRMLIIHDPEGYASRPFIMPVPPALHDECKKRGTAHDRKKGIHTSNLLIEGGVVYAIQAKAEADKGLPCFADLGPGRMNSAWPLNEIDGRFPDYRRVVCKAFASERAHDACYNPNYIAEFRTAARHLCGFGNKYPSVLVQPREDEAAIVTMAYRGDAHAIGLLMPMSRMLNPLDAPPFYVTGAVKGERKAKKRGTKETAP